MRPGGARNPHVFLYTLRFLRSGGTQTAFARYVFQQPANRVELFAVLAAGHLQHIFLDGPTNAEILTGIAPEDVRATARTLRAIKKNMLKMTSGKDRE